jgi:hypothetical protein
MTGGIAIQHHPAINWVPFGYQVLTDNELTPELCLYRGNVYGTLMDADAPSGCVRSQHHFVEGSGARGMEQTSGN